MTRIAFVLASLLMLSAVGSSAIAQGKKCPKGKVPHPETGKCVVPDGSH